MMGVDRPGRLRRTEPLPTLAEVPNGGGTARPSRLVSEISVLIVKFEAFRRGRSFAL